MALYDSFADTFSKSRKNHPWPELDEIIDEIVTLGDISLLDVGCGNGRWLEECEKRWYTLSSYLGIDNSEGMIDEARKLHPDRDFSVVPMSAMGSLRSSYDVIVFLASFHHLDTVEERIRVLEATKSLLAPWGRIYMTNWNLLGQDRYVASHQGGWDFQIKIWAYTRYYHGFTLDELASLFTSAGYDILRHEIYPGGRNIFSKIRTTS